MTATTDNEVARDSATVETATDKDAASDVRQLGGGGSGAIRPRIVRSADPGEPARRWYTLADIAEAFGVSSSTVQTWAARRWPFFPRCIKLPSGRLLVRADWYEEWLAALEVA